MRATLTGRMTGRNRKALQDLIGRASEWLNVRRESELKERAEPAWGNELCLEEDGLTIRDEPVPCAMYFSKD